MNQLLVCLSKIIPVLVTLISIFLIINGQFVLQTLNMGGVGLMVTQDKQLTSNLEILEHMLGYINGIVYGFRTDIGMIMLVNEASAENVIGFQNTAKTPIGDLTACSGNFIVPSTVCVGSNANDTIVGTVAGSTIFGKDGNDMIRGLLSQQVIFGNDGNDSIQGGNGTNIAFGNNGDDILVGGSGFDFMKGGGGSLLTGNAGNDKLIGGPDHDVLEGGPGLDFFQCNGKVDLVLDFNVHEDKASGNCIFS